MSFISIKIGLFRAHYLANHLDEDEDRFADEFVVGFSLLHQQTQQHQTSIKRKNKNYPYRNAYHHRSLSFLHQQHHHYLHQQHHRNNYLRM